MKKYQFTGGPKVTVRSMMIVLFLLAFQSSATAQVRNVWAVSDGEKIFRNEDNHPDKSKNLIWDGRKIHLKGLYNEVLAVQVIVETDLKGAEALEVSVLNPINKSSGKVIGGSTQKYGPEGTIEIFSQHYHHVTDSTAPLWFYGSLAAQPKVMTGWMPDALIPTDALPGRGGFPLDIPPVDSQDRHFKGRSGQNQGFWIDIHLPRDQKGFPAGTYTGRVQVMEQGRIVSDIPLEVSLVPQYLTDMNHSNIWMYSGDIVEYFTEMAPDDIDRMIKFEAHRHRINMEGGFSVNRTPFDRIKMDQYKAYLDGSGFTAANGYHGPGEGYGERIFPIGMYGSKVLGETQSEVHKQSDLWVEWFKNNAPQIVYFWYIIDEPQHADIFPWIQERAGWVKSNTGPGKSLPVFTTSHYREELAGSIDIWAAYNGVDLDKLQMVRDKGGDYWFYNGKRPRTGSLIMEAPAVDMRVNCWILYKYGINEWFIWESTHWRHNHQGPKGHLHQNVYKSPLTFINEDMEFANGDGVLFYPGKMPFYPDQDRGLNRLFPSIRLKNVRRGQQDVNLMWMVEQKLGRQKVLDLIEKVLPKAMSEVPETDKVPWSEKGSDFDLVREALIGLL